MLDLVVIGAGPVGLSCAIQAQNARLRVAVIDKGCLCNSIFRFPSEMQFFTSADRLEIGGVPFTSPNARPYRLEAMAYYRKVAAHHRLDVRPNLKAESLSGEDGAFALNLKDRYSRHQSLDARKIILATGYYDQPRLIGCPGEELSKVTHYYRDAFPYWRSHVLVVGGRTSAALAALDLSRRGANVTLIHRGPELFPFIKYWIRPALQERLDTNHIRAFFNSTLACVHHDEAVINVPGGQMTVQNDFVLALTGYRPDTNLLGKFGITFAQDASAVPFHDRHTFETNIKGVYVAGSVIAGNDTFRVFIENGRHHGRRIARHIAGLL